jgi:hypothetical protein
VAIKKPNNWIVVLYDVPDNPSRLKVRMWREFKRMGGLYPQLSVCLVPDNGEGRRGVENVEKLLTNNNNKNTFTVLTAKGLKSRDQGRILNMFRIDRDKRYEEILEECQEFIDEVNLNIKNKKTSQEEAEEMEEVLDGLYRWLDRVKSIDWMENSLASARVERLLRKCRSTMDKFVRISHPSNINQESRSGKRIE